MEGQNVSLTISKDVVNPIVEAKIKEAIIQALGGSDALVAKVVDGVLHQRVDATGKVSNYSSDNKYDWLDIVVSAQIKEAVTKELKEQISQSSQAIKDELIKGLKTKRGASMVATALLAGLEKTFEQTWTSHVDVHILPKSS